jgi:hypothetical protein
MPLDPKREQVIRAEAKRRGVNPDEAVKRAGGPAPEPQDGEGGPDASGKPTFERLLIGAFPFLKVRELRSIWLGLDERVPDDEMMCGDFAAKHGGAAPAPASTEPE